MSIIFAVFHCTSFTFEIVNSSGCVFHVCDRHRNKCVLRGEAGKGGTMGWGQGPAEAGTFLVLSYCWGGVGWVRDREDSVAELHTASFLTHNKLAVEYRTSHY